MEEIGRAFLISNLKLPSPLEGSAKGEGNAQGVAL